MALAVPHYTAHTRDDDDGRGAWCVFLSYGGLKERQKGNSREIDCRHVGLEDAVPVFDGFVVPDLVMELGRRCGIWGSLGA